MPNLIIFLFQYIIFNIKLIFFIVFNNQPIPNVKFFFFVIKQIGTSEAYLNQIINMKKHPSPSVAKKVTDQLQMEFSDLFIVD